MTHVTCVDIREQVSAVLLLCQSQGWSSGHQALPARVFTSYVLFFKRHDLTRYSKPYTQVLLPHPLSVRIYRCWSSLAFLHVFFKAVFVFMLHLYPVKKEVRLKQAEKR